jgi:signal transduction histidine kinase
VLDDVRATTTARSATVVVGALPTGAGSPRLLERVLQNLVVNAVQYGDPETPVVRIEGVDHGDHVSLSVTDNGAGVPVADRDRIFDMFTRGAAAAQAPGSGIGLAFARRVAARHGGTLAVTDSENGGARFTLRLPKAPRDTAGR